MLRTNVRMSRREPIERRRCPLAAVWYKGGEVVGTWQWFSFSTAGERSSSWEILGDEVVGEICW